MHVWATHLDGVFAVGLTIDSQVYAWGFRAEQLQTALRTMSDQVRSGDHEAYDYTACSIVQRTARQMVQAQEASVGGSLPWM